MDRGRGVFVTIIYNKIRQFEVLLKNTSLIIGYIVTFRCLNVTYTYTNSGLSVSLATDYIVTLQYFNVL